MGPSPFMRFGMIARKLCSLVGGSKTPPTRPYATIKMAPFRRLSTLPYWDSLPVNHRIWYSREVDETDLEDPLMFFKRNPIFDSISSNMLLGKKVKENSFWREILNMNPSMLSKVAGTAFRSLGCIALDNHGRGIPLGAAACLENLRISRSSGRCVLLNIKPRAPEAERLTLQQRANDWLAIRDLIIRVVELSDGAAEAKYPVDFLHWLDKLAEDNPRLWLIMYHPIFLSMNGKFSYRVAIDQLLKKEPQEGCEAVICDALRMIGDNLGGLLSLAEKHELLNGVMTYSPRRPRGTSKGKTAAVVNPAGQPPSSADAAGATAASVKDVHPASPADPAAAPVGVNDPTAQSTEKKDKKHRKKLARLRLRTGRKVVGLSRDPLVHGLQTSCEGFNFVDSTMLKRYDLHQLVYFVMLPYDHTVLQILFDKRLHKALDMEGFFGEDTSTWKKALDQQERDDKELAKKSLANSFSNVQLEDKRRKFRKDHSKQNNLAKKQTHGSVKNPKNSQFSEGKNSQFSEGKNSQFSEGKSSQLSEGKNPKLSEGKNPKLNEGKNPKLNEGKNPKLNEGKNPKLNEGKNSKLSEGENSQLSEGETSKLSEGENSKLSEGKIAKLREAKNPKLSEGKTSKLSEGKTSKLSEGKTHGSPKNTFQRYEKGTRGQQYKYNKGANGQHYKSEKGAKSQYFYRNKRGWDNKK